MTVEQGTRRIDPARLAAAARSILACPGDVELAVDGIDDVTAGLDEADGALAMRDVDGRPVFSCPADSMLAVAAADGRHALLTVTSGVGRPGSRSREAVLTLAGRLETTGLEECHCCDQVRVGVALVLDYAQLARSAGDGRHVVPHRVPLPAYSSPAHQLNRGFLQRAAEHANACHQEELRRAVATTSNTLVGDIVGVHLTGLRPDRVEVQWVDGTGAHSRVLAFGRAATTAAELGELMRARLHAGLC